MTSNNTFLLGGSSNCRGNFAVLIEDDEVVLKEYEFDEIVDVEDEDDVDEDDVDEDDEVEELVGEVEELVLKTTDARPKKEFKQKLIDITHQFKIPEIDAFLKAFETASSVSFRTRLPDSEVKRLLNGIFPQGQYYITIRPDMKDQRLQYVIVINNGFPGIEIISTRFEKAEVKGLNYITFTLRGDRSAISEWVDTNCPPENGYSTNIIPDRKFGDGVWFITIRDMEIVLDKQHVSSGQHASGEQHASSEQRIPVERNTIPGKEFLQKLFAKSNPVVGMSQFAALTLKRELIEDESGKSLGPIHGYKFTYRKVQPDNLDLVNITVFKQDNNVKAGFARSASAR